MNCPIARAVLAGGALLAAAGLARGEARATLRMRDCVGLDWGPSVVTYHVTFDPAVEAAQVRVADSAGAPVLCQLADEMQVKGGRVAEADLRFLATLPANGTAEYTVTVGAAKVAPPANLTPVTVTSTPLGIELGNGKVRLRLPAAARQSNESPVAASAVPGPLQGVQLADGTWAGKASLITERAVAAFSCQVIEEGPVSARVRLEYAFAPAGHYRVIVRLDQDAPLAVVEEEFDFGEFTDGRDIVAFDLGAGWKPDAIAWLSERPFKQSAGLGERLEAVKARGWTVSVRQNDSAIGYYEMSLADAASEAGEYVHPWAAWGVTQPVPPAQNWLYMMPWGDWGPRAAYVAACRAPAAAGETAPQVGVLSLHAGSWRRPSNAVVRLRVGAEGTAVLEMPVSCFGVMRPFNPFDSAEEDGALPPTLGRRTWGLVSGIRDPAELMQWQVRHGMIGLDRYKDWILEWDAKEELDPRTYPRASARRQDLDAVRAALDTHPFREALTRNYLVAPTTENGQAAAARAQAELAKWLPGRASSMVSHFRMAENDRGLVPVVDAALAWPGLEGEGRRLLLARIAAMAYVLSDPDFNPRGIGMHLGNPNMPINRFMGFPQYAGLLPSHPMHEAWMTEANRYSLWKWADNVSPGGAWREEISYQQAGVPHLMDAALSLRNSGALDPAVLPYVREQNQYNLACVCPPDANEGGLRGCEGTGNGGRVRAGFPVYAANLLKDTDPQMAGEMMWLWQSFGTPTQTQYGLSPLAVDTTIAPLAPRDVPAAFLPGYGATARAHFGTPGEAFLMFRCGYNQSHYDMDQGSFKFYALGEQLVPNSSCGYNSAEPANTQHGILSFGDPEWFNNHGRTDSIVVDRAFLGSVDHLLGWQRFDSKSGGNQGNRAAKEPFAWYRQFLFMKGATPASPSYLVLRDTLRGKGLEPSHWHCWLNGRRDGITVHGNRVEVPTPQGNRLDVVFADPAVLEPVSFTWKETVGGSGCAFPKTGATQMRLTRPAGQGYLAVFCPRRADAPPPTVERLSEGALKIVTPEGTDYVFLSPDTAVAFRDAEVSFDGRAGAVRMRGDEVRLILASGAGRVGYKEHTLRGDGPFEAAMPKAQAETKADRAVPPAVPVPAALPFTARVKGVTQEVQPGVTQVKGEAGVSYLFDSPTELDVTTADGVRFRGRRGAVELLDGAVRYVMQPDPQLGHLCEAGHGGFVIRGEGPYDLTFAESAEPGGGGEITGMVAGRSRVLDMPMPMNLVPPNCRQKALPAGQLQAQVAGPILTGVAPTLYINGQQWQIGYYDRSMALSVFDGENRIRITRFRIPPLPALPARKTVAVRGG
ncbi:MAG: hypothetical protein BWZ02_01485 [Lentisphaerae bacterium ADurb.BinA184]|nr:MAG: hypothetical protein BWZ02_01485 [Lentisphaerae bacterium ADurb.BinA184]